MTNYHNIVDKTLDELAEWLNKEFGYNETPWDKWFDQNYCQKCESIKSEDDWHTYAPCELKDPETGEYNNPCGFAHCENTKIIKAWLVQEVVQ